MPSQPTDDNQTVPAPAFVMDRDMQGFSRMPSVPEIIEPDKDGRRIVYPEPLVDSSCPSSGSKFPLFVQSQNYVVYNLANRQQNPKCASAGYRILGLFSTLDQAKSYTKRNFIDPDINIFVSATHQLGPICESEHDQNNAVYRQNVIEAITKIYTDKIELHRQEFEQNVREQKTGVVGQSELAKAMKAKEEKKEGAKEESKEGTIREPQPLTSQCQLLNQNYSVVIHLLDNRESVGKKEPLFSVLASFGNVADASEYARTTATKQYPKCAIDVVDNYQWLFPMSVSPEEILEEYGCSQLNDIMAGRKQNIRSCQEYERSRAGDEKK